MPDENGQGAQEPSSDTTYMRVNLHCDILNGEESLSTAAYNSDDKATTITNSEAIVMFPEVEGVNWGEIVGFGIYGTAAVGSGTPILWDRLANKDEHGNYISVLAETERVPLFRKNQFKVTLN
jgi:hypothetical protein